MPAKKKTAKKAAKSDGTEILFEDGVVDCHLFFNQFLVYPIDGGYVGIAFWWDCPVTSHRSPVGTFILSGINIKRGQTSFKDYVSRSGLELSRLPDTAETLPRLEFGPPKAMDVISMATYQGCGEIELGVFSYKSFVDASSPSGEKRVLGSGMTLLRSELTVHIAFVDQLIKLQEADD